jgi:hypothetical protein
VYALGRSEQLGSRAALGRERSFDLFSLLPSAGGVWCCSRSFSLPSHVFAFFAFFSRSAGTMRSVITVLLAVALLAGAAELEAEQEVCLAGLRFVCVVCCLCGCVLCGV